MAEACPDNFGSRIAPVGGYAATRKLYLARLNAALLLTLLYMEDVFWIIASRVQIATYEPFYNVATFEWINLFSFVAVAIIFSIVGVVFSFIVRPLPKIHTPLWFLYSFISISILLNILMVFVLQDNARYTSGGLTGISGVIYGVGRAVSFGSMILFIRHKSSGVQLRSNIAFYGFVVSFIITMDGLANALTLMMFIILMMPKMRIRNIWLIGIVLLVAIILLWIGIKSKWSEIPVYVTPEFLIRWVIARFSVQAEHMFFYVSGQSIIGDAVSYMELVLRAISDRINLVLGGAVQLEYPRSVSEATFYDIRGYFGAGSSPGLLLGTALQGPLFFFVPPFILSFLFVNLFYGYIHRISFVELCAYSFLLKTLHANFSEYMTIVSPTLISVLLYIIACSLVFHNK